MDTVDTQNPMTPEAQVEVLQQLVVNQNILLARSNLAYALGKTFGGARDLYKVLGYKTELTFDDYLAKYDRQDIAGVVIEKPATETWRKPPVLKDGNTETGQEDTPFVQAFNALADRLKLWHYLTRVDILAGIGQYGAMLIGVRQGPLDAPLRKGQLKRPEDVIYFSVFDEQSAEIVSVVGEYAGEEADPRFGLPKIYKLNMGQTPTRKFLGQKRAHWSRVIHVAEGLLESDVFGQPRLKKVFNRLEDLEKVVGGSAEAVWKLVYKGMTISSKDGHTLPTDLTALRDKAENFMHGLERVMMGEGLDFKMEGGEVVDPSAMFTILVRLISSETSIPWQMLIGSERGDVSNKQDQTTWAGFITSRQTNYAEPILRELINRLVWMGALPAPTHGEYTIEWPPLFELTELEEAELASKRATALKTAAEASAFVEETPEEIRGFGGLSPKPEGTTETAILDDEDSLVGVDDVSH